jgi:enoyl-CoA hydratase/carnithine racemase
MKLKITKHSPGYWRVTFNNPPLNLMDPEMTQELSALVSQLENEEELKVVVFDSSVPGYFMAHIDLARVADFDLSPGPTGLSAWPDVARRLELAPFLTIASVRGRARGVGSEFIQAMDICFASEEQAILAQVEVGCGLIPGGGGLERLPYKIGKSRALEVIIGAEDFDAKTAERYGWINRAIPDSALDEVVERFAMRVSGFEKNSIATAKRIIYERLGLAAVDAFKQTQSYFFELANQPEVQKKIETLFKLGINVPGDFEWNLGSEIGKL